VSRKKTVKKRNYFTDLSHIQYNKIHCHYVTSDKHASGHTALHSGNNTAFTHWRSAAQVPMINTNNTPL